MHFGGASTRKGVRLTRDWRNKNMRQDLRDRWMTDVVARGMEGKKVRVSAADTEDRTRDGTRATSEKKDAVATMHNT